MLLSVLMSVSLYIMFEGECWKLPNMLYPNGRQTALVEKHSGLSPLLFLNCCLETPFSLFSCQSRWYDVHWQLSSISIFRSLTFIIFCDQAIIFIDLCVLGNYIMCQVMLMPSIFHKLELYYILYQKNTEASLIYFFVHFNNLVLWISRLKTYPVMEQWKPFSRHLKLA